MDKTLDKILDKTLDKILDKSLDIENTGCFLYVKTDPDIKTGWI